MKCIHFGLQKAPNTFGPAVGLDSALICMLGAHSHLFKAGTPIRILYFDFFSALYMPLRLGNHPQRDTDELLHNLLNHRLFYQQAEVCKAPGRERGVGVVLQVAWNPLKQQTALDKQVSCAIPERSDQEVQAFLACTTGCYRYILLFCLMRF